MVSSAEIKLYLEKAYLALEQSQANLKLDYFDLAISRAYYAMFYAATALLRSQNISRSKHSGVHSAFGLYFVKPGLIEPEYSRMLGNAFNIRLDSDYDINLSFDKDLAKDVLNDAEQFVERISRYLQEEGYL